MVCRMLLLAKDDEWPGLLKFVLAEQKDRIVQAVLLHLMAV